MFDWMFQHRVKGKLFFNIRGTDPLKTAIERHEQVLSIVLKGEKVKYRIHPGRIKSCTMDELRLVDMYSDYRDYGEHISHYTIIVDCWSETWEKIKRLPWVTKVVEES